jgi:hypothetical protein
MALIELSPKLKEIFKMFGEREEEETIKIFIAGLKEFLKECEEDILDFEIKYGLSFEKFKVEFEKGKFGDPHSYPLEKDAMKWEDLIKEKEFRLNAVRKLECFN